MVKRKLDDNTETLDRLGYRLTPQRLLVLRAVDESRGHVSVEEIFESVSASYPNISLSTIYRTLDLLEEIGLVTKSDLGAGRVQYHRTTEADHHHLVCQQCGRIGDLDQKELAPFWEMLQERHHFKASQRHMVVFGICGECQSLRSAAASPR